MWLLIKDAWYAKSLKDKLRIWFMPTGWRPADVAEKFPVYKIDDVYHFGKYDTKASNALHVWVWAQLIVLLLFISYLFGNIAAIGKPQIFIYGGFVFLFVYALAELMDGSRYVIVWEFVKCIVGAALMYYYGGWFGADKYFAAATYFIAGYFILSLVVTVSLWQAQKNKMAVKLTA